MSCVPYSEYSTCKNTVGSSLLPDALRKPCFINIAVLCCFSVSSYKHTKYWSTIIASSTVISGWTHTYASYCNICWLVTCVFMGNKNAMCWVGLDCPVTMLTVPWFHTARREGCSVPSFLSCGTELRRRSLNKRCPHGASGSVHSLSTGREKFLQGESLTLKL